MSSIKKYVGPAVALVSVVIVLGSLIYIKKSLLLENRKVLIGVWTEEFWNNQTKTLNIQKIKTFEKTINKKVAIANYYKGWDELDNPQAAQELASIDANGWTPMVSTNPYHTNKCQPARDDIYSAIAKGDCDLLLRNIAGVLRDYGKPLFLRFAWEMNIDSNPWSIQSTYSSPKAFIAAWQHIHTLFTSEGVKNAKWVFSVNVENPNTIPAASLYPGDNYVDWTGIDGYNYGTTQSWSRWTSFNEIFQTTYEQLLTIAPEKPLMISEFNSESHGGNKSAWFADALDMQIPNNYPKIRAIIFFNENKTVAEGVDWRLETSESVLETVKKSLRNPIY